MQPELRDYLRILGKHRTLVLLGLIGCLIGAGALTYLSTPIYEAEARMFVGQRQISTTEVAQGQTVTDLSAKLLKSYAAILRTHPIAAQAIENEGLRNDPRDLSEAIKAEPILDTQLISLKYRSSNPSLAQRTVNAVANAFVHEVQRLEGPSTTPEEEPAVKVSVVAPALVPDEPVSPDPVRNFGLAVVLGLLLGVGFAFLAEQLDTTVKGRDEIESQLGLPVLATVPKIRTRVDENYLEGDNQSAFAESFRKLRTAIQLYGTEARVQTVLVSSPFAEEGKTTTALNLAAVYAYAGNSTVLVEADLRRPRLHQMFPTNELNGLAMALLGRINVERGIVQTGIPNFACLPAGAIPPNPVEMLASMEMRTLLDQLRLRYEIVVIDAPPLLPVADASTLAGRTDGVLLVARMKETRRDRLAEAGRLVEKVGGRVLGVVLNAVAVDEAGGDYSYYTYGDPRSRRRSRSTIRS